MLSNSPISHVMVLGPPLALVRTPMTTLVPRAEQARPPIPPPTREKMLPLQKSLSKSAVFLMFLILSIGILGHNGVPAADAGTWTATGPMPSVRGGHAAVLLPNGQVLVAGGTDYSGHDGAFVTSAALYDPSNNTWSPTGSMATPRGGYTLTLLGNGKVLAAGGANWSGTLASAELYDYTTGQWTAAESMPNVHHWSHRHPAPQRQSDDRQRVQHPTGVLLLRHDKRRGYLRSRLRHLVNYGAGGGGSVQSHHCAAGQRQGPGGRR